ncbi:LOW QUALITY PROTEIN: RNA-binding protein 28-like [Liolophura sinensis]|uniref:LOW QUALITY PROTEIN: RNA-binding protein 28-like n=1 Tax=Liolophura sinensis TaxID=3198878 RepID=UPI0031583884
MAARSDDHAEPRQTLFIRNLPFSVTEQRLEEVFSEIGPVKRCILVKDKETGRGKGYGFVVYSMLEDAVEAKSKIKKVDGRNVFVLYSKKKKYKRKSPKEDRYVSLKSKPKEIPENANADAQSTKYMRAKQVVVTGFSGKLDSTTLEQATQNVKNIAKVRYPVKGRSDTTVILTFKCVRDSKRAVRRLNGRDFRGQTLQAWQHSSEFVKEPVKSENTAEKSSFKLQKQCRLIIRNLSFKCTEEDLRNSFQEFGEISEVIIPMRSDGKQHGFGFVQYNDLKSAEKALKTMNMKQIKGRPVAVDWAVPKGEFMKATAKTTKTDSVSSPDEGAVSGVAGEESSSEEEEEEDQARENKQKEGDESDDLSEEDEGFSSKEDSEESEEEKEDDSESDADDESDDQSESESDDSLHKKKKSKENQIKKQKPNELKEGRTLFIRNINFDSVEEELEELLEEFGEIDYCKFVMNHFTEKPKGTAFVQFATEESAQECLQKANDESARGGIVLDGRKLNVILAVSRQDAARLKQENQTKEKDDKRNLYLAREGLIRPGTLAAEGLSKGDLDMRLKVENVKRQKLKKPNIFISTTRLCIRNIPVKTTDKELKKIFQQAAGDRKAQVTECRIMKDMTQVNAKGEGKSRGYGFVEFTEHHHALEALRKTNNNPEIFGEKKRPVVEFSLENKTALEAKRKRWERIKAKREALAKNPLSKQKSDSKQGRTTEKKGKSENTVAKQTDASGLVKGKSTVTKGAKRPKVLPSHSGPKIRQRDQGKQPGKKANKNRPSRKEARGQSGQKRKSSVEGMEPKKKKYKANRREKTDDFDAMVTKYRNKILASSKKTGMKWFAD